MDMSGHVRDRAYAGQNINCRLLPSSVPHHSLSAYDVRTQRWHHLCLDLQHPRHYLSMPSGTRGLGLYTSQGLPSHRQILLFHHRLLNLHGLLALHAAVASVLAAQASAAAEVHCVYVVCSRAVRNRSLRSTDQCSQERR